VLIGTSFVFQGGGTTGANVPSGLGNPYTGFATTGITINNTGGGGAHNTMPLFGISNFIIKT
jgi:hypothetical protein